MKDVIYLLFDLLTTLAGLLRPGGFRAVVAENLLLKHQLIIHSGLAPTTIRYFNTIDGKPISEFWKSRR